MMFTKFLPGVYFLITVCLREFLHSFVTLLVEMVIEVQRKPEITYSKFAATGLNWRLIW